MSSATSNGQFTGNRVRWQIPLLEPQETRTFSFRVEVGGGLHIVNDDYRVISAEGISAAGVPVTTTIRGGVLYLPAIIR